MERIQPKAPPLALQLTDDVLDALDEQPVIVPEIGTRGPVLDPLPRPTTKSSGTSIQGEHAPHRIDTTKLAHKRHVIPPPQHQNHS